ncbi:hypothetical protein FIBSPDRAFT_846355 [Athelia psychrophila]|uniref:Secreted protein n=1 Tax=Athelia psychrophila TaxID=1759441 RepID=A0A166WYT3_9AGAM|nr:hypothetical protein FIBSPDRAFT_846355 [Fibularhizoctonia sp. CBS 109695]
MQAGPRCSNCLFLGRAAFTTLLFDLACARPWPNHLHRCTRVGVVVHPPNAIHLGARTTDTVRVPLQSSSCTHAVCHSRQPPLRLCGDTTPC